MNLTSCLMDAVDQAIQKNNFFPLITYKVSMPISVALNAFISRYALASEEHLAFVIAYELCALSFVAFYSYDDYAPFKAELAAYAQGLGGYRFPVKLGYTLTQNPRVGAFALNVVRGIVTINGIDDILFQSRFRKMNDKEVVALIGSLALLFFSTWAALYAITNAAQYRPNYDRCFT